MADISKKYQNDCAAEQLPTKNEFDYGLLKELNQLYKKSISLSSGSSPNPTRITCMETEVGTMIAGATDKGICLFEFADSKKVETELKQLITLYKAPLEEGDHIHFNILRKQIEEYFRGELREFNLPLDVKGTDFQVQAWLGLRNIPYGYTTSYAKQAESLGRPAAVRAVANANGKNRISILLPCHRVIGTDGSLTGYGGQLWRKKKLLELERQVLNG